MKKFAFAIAATVLSLPLLANAAGKNAAMQVTFTVKESCTVQTATDKQASQPAVACQLNTPFQLNRAAAQPAAQANAGSANGTNGANSANSTTNANAAIQQPRADGAAAQDWTVYF